MSHTPNYISGSHLFTCDRCGSVYHADKKRKEWTGLMVCGGPGTNHCWEPRHPQEFIRARPEDPSIREARPDPYTFPGLPYWEGLYAMYGSDNEPYVSP